MPTYEGNNDRYTASVWGAANEDLQMPSGQLALVRKPGVEQLIAAGIINDLDSLSAIAQGLIDKADGKSVAKPEDVLNNPERLTSMLHLIDRVVCHTVVKPTVLMPPNDITTRAADAIYTDMIDLEDKFFIFNYVMGGTTSIAAFRKETEAAVGGVVPVAEDADQA